MFLFFWGEKFLNLLAVQKFLTYFFLVSTFQSESFKLAVIDSPHISMNEKIYLKNQKLNFFAKIYYDAYCSGLKHVGDPENWIYQDTEDAPAHMCRFETYLTYIYNWFVCLSVSNILQRFGIISIAMLIFIIYAT